MIWVKNHLSVLAPARSNSFASTWKHWCSLVEKTGLLPWSSLWHGGSNCTHFAHSNCWSPYLHCIVVPLPSSPWLPVTSMAKNLPNLSSEQSWNKETIHRCQRQNRRNCEANKNSPDMFDILDLEAPCDTPWSFKINGINPGCFRYVGSRILIRPIWRPWMIIIESSLNHHAHVMHMSCTLS